jgi:hypothetical protein
MKTAQTAARASLPKFTCQTTGNNAGLDLPYRIFSFRGDRAWNRLPVQARSLLPNIALPILFRNGGMTSRANFLSTILSTILSTGPDHPR